MANNSVDNKIVISVSVDTKNAIKKLQELKKSIKSISAVNFENLGKISNSIKPKQINDLKNAEKAIQKVQKASNLTQKKVNDTSQLQKQLSSVKKITNSIAERNKELGKAINLPQALEERGKNSGIAYEDALSKKRDEENRKFFTARTEPTAEEEAAALKNRKAFLSNTIEETKKVEPKKIIAPHKSAMETYKNIQQSLAFQKELSERMQKAKMLQGVTRKDDTTVWQDISKKLSGFGKSAGKVSKTFGKSVYGLFGAIKEYRKAHNMKGLSLFPSKTPQTGIPKAMSQLGRIAMYRLFRAFIKAIKTAIQEGFTTLASYDKKAKQSISEFTSQINYLKNTFATFAYNIFEAIKQPLMSFINYMVSQFNTASIAIASMMGKDSYKKAVNVWKEFGQTVSASFDELNVIGDQTTKNPFEDVSLPSDAEATALLTKMKSILAISILVGMKFANFGVAFKMGGILLLLSSLKKSFTTLYNENEEFNNAVMTFVSKIKTIPQSIYKVMEKISLFLDKAFEKHSSEIINLSNSLFSVVDYILRAISGISTFSSDMFASLENDGSNLNAFFTSFSNLLTTVLDTVFQIVDNVFAIISGNKTEIYSLGGTILSIFTTLNNIIINILEKVKDIFSESEDGLTNIIKPFVVALNGILSIFDKAFKEVKSIADIFSDILSPLISSLITIIQPILDIILIIFEILKPIVDLINTITAAIIKLKLTFIIDGLKMIFDIIDKIFDWIDKKIPISLKTNGNIFEKIVGYAEKMESISAYIDSLINNWTDGIDNFFESVKDWIFKIPNWIKDAYKQISGKVGEWFDKVVSWGGDAWTFTKEVFTGQSFASGGFVNQGTAFIAGEAGAEMVGNINGRTGVMNQSQITTAFAEALVNTGYLNQENNSNETPSFNIYLDGKKIASAVEKANYNKSASFYKNGKKGSAF